MKYVEYHLFTFGGSYGAGVPLPFVVKLQASDPYSNAPPPIIVHPRAEIVLR